MYRIDENTYIDTRLITCPEYQLFIDEMLAEGKHVEPDHWNMSQFQNDQAESPVFGVRHSDAAGFCDWLTQRGDGQWLYRLPTGEEASLYPIETLSIAPSGYWISQSNYPNFMWINRNAEVEFPIDLDRVYELDRARPFPIDHERYREVERAHALILDRTRVYNRDNAIDQVITSANKIAYDLMHVIAQDMERDLTNPSEQDLERILARERAHIYGNLDRDRDLALVNNLGSDLERADMLTHSRARILALAGDLAGKLLIDPNRVRNLDRELEVIHENTRIRIRDSDRASILDRGLALALERDLERACARARELVNILSSKRSIYRAHARSLAFNLISDLNKALIHNLASDLDLARHLSSSLNFDQIHFPSIMVLISASLYYFLLNLRINNAYPAFEGIRILRERNPQFG